MLSKCLQINEVCAYNIKHELWNVVLDTHIYTHLLIQIEGTPLPVGISLYSLTLAASSPSISAYLCHFPGQNPQLCSLHIPCLQAPDLDRLLSRHKGSSLHLSPRTITHWIKSLLLEPSFFYKKRHCHQHHWTEQEAALTETN